jgi:hypothetical protein
VSGRRAGLKAEGAKGPGLKGERLKVLGLGVRDDSTLLQWCKGLGQGATAPPARHSKPRHTLTRQRTSPLPTLT